MNKGSRSALSFSFGAVLALCACQQAKPPASAPQTVAEQAKEATAADKGVQPNPDRNAYFGDETYPYFAVEVCAKAHPYSRRGWLTRCLQHPAEHEQAAEENVALSTTMQTTHAQCAITAGRRAASIGLYLAAAAMFAGCAHIGPNTVVADRFDYSAAIADSWKQQTLLNIVKLRYMDLPVFVDVSSIVAGYSLQSGVNIGDTESSKGAYQGNFIAAGAQAVYTDRPTITYVPMTGNQFLHALLTPIDPTKIFFMLQSGYAADFILALTVESLNGVRNRSVAVDRDYWFWVDDGDWQTKRALGAIMFFFTLEESGGQDKQPVITIPAQ